MNGVKKDGWHDRVGSSYVVCGAEVISCGKRTVKDVYVSDGVFVDQRPAQKIDCSGKIVTPGLIDIHIHGIGGKDFLSPGSLSLAQKLLPQYGITGFLPSIGTSPISVYEKIPSFPSEIGAIPLGWHLEGPFLHPLYAGAHNPKWLLKECDAVFWKKVFENTPVTMITVAPEVLGSSLLMKLAHDCNIVIACGHCAPTYDDLLQAKELGASFVTHIFNGMAPFHHRGESLLGAVLGNKLFPFSLICDGIHVSPEAIRIAHSCFPCGCVITSDSTPLLCSEAKDGEFLGSAIHVEKERVLTADGHVAGSIVPLDEQMRRYMEITQCSFIEAIEAVSTRPAHILRLDHRKGAIELGYDADFVLWDDQSVWMTVVGGRPVFCKDVL